MDPVSVYPMMLAAMSGAESHWGSRKKRLVKLDTELRFIGESLKDLVQTAYPLLDRDESDEKPLKSTEAALDHMSNQLNECQVISEKLHGIFEADGLKKIKRLNPNIHWYLIQMRSMLNLLKSSFVILHATLSSKMEAENRTNLRDLLHALSENRHMDARTINISNSRVEMSGSKRRDRHPTDSSGSHSGSDDDIVHLGREVPRPKKKDVPRLGSQETRFRARILAPKSKELKPIDQDEIIHARGLLDLESDANFLLYRFAERNGFLADAEDILKPKEIVGPEGRLVRPVKELHLKWTAASGEGLEKLQTTHFYLMEPGRRGSNNAQLVVGKSYADFDGIFGDHDTSVYAWRFPHKTRQVKEAEKKQSEDHRDANLQEERDDLEADREERRLRFATASPSASSALSIRSGSSNLAPAQAATAQLPSPPTTNPLVRVMPSASPDPNAASSSAVPPTSLTRSTTNPI